MKNCFSCLLLGTLSLFQSTPYIVAQSSKDQKLPFQVQMDPRVELICIIFRLAENPEYTRASPNSYTRDVDKHFLPFKNHPAVQLARKLRRTRGVSYDAPMSLAVHITDAFTLKEKVPFEPHPPGLDGRWRLDEVRQFLKLTRDFSQKTRFKDFIQAHQQLYDSTAKRLSEMMTKHAHLEWFDTFFGQRSASTFHLAVAMLNGPNCYAARVTIAKEKHIYCILGTWRSDKKDIPLFSKNVLPTVIHEFGHSYVNHLVASHAADFEKAGKKIFRTVQQSMKAQAYSNWQTMIHESIVRACVVRYLTAHEGPFAAFAEIQRQHLRGFFWTGELAGLLAQYESQRQKYPTFEDFMPRIVEFFEEYASRLPKPPAQTSSSTPASGQPPPPQTPQQD